MNGSTDNPTGGPLGQGPQDGQGPNGPGPQPQGPYSEQLKHSPVSARLPEKVAQGVFCSGAIVLEGPEEFVIDFVQGVVRPPRVGARVVVNPHVMSQLVGALKDNLAKYEQSFGPPKAMPKPNTDRRPSIREVYDDLKIADEQLCGVYATTALIGHTPSEFIFDFITRFFPTASVSARVYLSASQVPRVLETFTTSLQHFMQRGQPGPQQPGPQPPGQPPLGSQPGQPAFPPSGPQPPGQGGQPQPPQDGPQGPLSGSEK